MSDFVRGLLALTALAAAGRISPIAVLAQAETGSAPDIQVTKAVGSPDPDERPAADGPRTSEESRTDDAAPGESDPRDGGADADTKADLERLRRLLRDRPAEDAPTDNPLSRAIRGMRSAHERIAASDTSGETRAIQRQVIDDLAALIELAKQPPPPSQENPPPEQSPDERESERPSEPQADSREGESESESEQQGTQQEQQQSDRARESADRAREAEAREAELRRRQNLVDGVWGHLPPSVRNKILSGSGDEYLHDYEHLARRYFEALAEQGARER